MHRKVKIRSMLIGVVFTILFLGLISRMYWVQIVEASILQQKAEKMWQDESVIPAKRGTIMDRKDEALAVEGPAFTVSVSPSIIAGNQEDLEAAAAKQKKLGNMTVSIAQDQLAHEISHGVAAILSIPSGVDPTALENKIFALTAKKKQDSNDLAVDVEIRNEGLNIDAATKLKIDGFIDTLTKKYQANNIDFINIGVYSKESDKRYYPFNSLASQVLGYMDRDGNPIGGLEGSLDDLLKGKPGMRSVEKDKQGVELLNSKGSYTPAINGDNIRLTIDHNIQFYAETAINKVMDQFHPISMTAIVVDPQTMEILAMASAPSFDPNKYWEATSQDSFINRAISDAHEPGSTFKIVTLAGTVAEKMFDPAEIYQSGSVNVTGVSLHDHNNGDGWGKITFLDGLLRSSNVGFVKLGLKLGPVLFRSYIDKFGYGMKTGIDLPHESAGTIAMNYPVEYATATYGQGQVVVTAIQQIAAYAAIANGGKLMWPHVIKDIIDPETNKVIKSFAPRVIRQVVSPEVAQQTSLLLEQVVSNQTIGTGRKAFENGYRIAGKTGTGSVLVPGEHSYSDTQYLISFIGYAPVENPRLLVAVIADQPDLDGNYENGSKVWAPAFNEIMSQSLRYLGVPSTAVDTKVSPEETIKTIPDLSKASISNAKSLLNQVGLEAEVLGDGGSVLKQFPPAGTEISRSQQVYLATSNNVSSLPDFKGKSLRDVLEVCSLLNLKCKAAGVGYVTSQAIERQGIQQTFTFELHPLSDPEVEPVAAPADNTNKPANTPGKTDTTDKTDKLPPQKSAKKEVTASSIKK